MTRLADIVVNPEAIHTLVIVLVMIAALVVLYFVRIHIAYKMAKRRHRDPLGWVLLSIFVSPVLTWIILLIVGDKS